MYSELKKHLLNEVDFSDCKYRLQYEKALLKALMRALQVGTLFVTYNSLHDDLQVFSSDNCCSDELVCFCDECINDCN